MKIKSMLYFIKFDLATENVTSWGKCRILSFKENDGY